MSAQSKHYRPEIDGLRAIAVVAVILYHAFPGHFAGGYWGVDIFFVISGYLITGIILRDAAAERFSVREFYQRRIRRLFPALSVMLALLLVAGALVLLPVEFVQLAKHVVSGSLFVSNLVLWAEVGYFDASSVLKPLLHLWSLGVEEQFYFVWPLFIVFAARRRAVGLALGIAIAGSFIVAAVSSSVAAGAAFYDPLARFWELGLGAALAHGEAGRLRSLLAKKNYSEVAALCGLALVIAAFWEHHGDTAASAWRALLPTFGAALLIAAGGQSTFNRVVLSSRPFVWCGHISYPLYLWHWPLLSIPTIVLGTTPSPKARLLAIGLAVVLAQLTHSLVELRIRRHPGAAIARVRNWIGASLVITASAGIVWWTGGFPRQRGPWNVTNIAAFGAVPDVNSPGCAQRYGARPALARQSDWFCHANFPVGAEAQVVVVGDSHAHRLGWGMRELGGVTVLNISKGSCLPLLGYEASWPGQGPLGCDPLMTNLLGIASEQHPRAILLTGWFSRPYEGRAVLRTTKTVKEMMRETFESLASTPRVVVMLDVPELAEEPSSCVERPYQRLLGRLHRCEFSRAKAMAQRKAYEVELRDVASAFPNVTIFDPWDLLCDGDRCSPIRDGALLYDDRNHLSHVGAMFVARSLKDATLGAALAK